MASLYDPKKDKVERFASPEELVAYIDGAPEGAPSVWRGYSEHNASWAGCSATEALKRLRMGDTQHLARAETLIEQMREEGLFSHGQRIWETSVVGSYPCVPHAIMGLPDTMYSHVETDLPSTTSPIRIFVQLEFSGGIPKKEYETRGVAVLGFVLAMQQIRPIELNVLSILDPLNTARAHGMVTRIETSPLDLDRATFMICDPAFTRQIAYGVGHRVAEKPTRSSWLPWAWQKHPTDANVMASVREMLELNDDDVYIPGMFLSDTKYRNDPIGWIKNELKKYGIDKENEH